MVDTGSINKQLDPNIWTDQLEKFSALFKGSFGVGDGDGVIPPPGQGPGGDKMNALIPLLPAPKVGGLSLESLVQAVGMEERQTATKSGLESLKAKAQERDDANAKKLEEIQKRLEEMRSQGFLQGLLKAFKIIGMILGAIAAVATIAIGALTGNPLLIAAGSIFAAMTINSILSEASGGKISIASGIAELAKACGASEEVAQWIGFGMEMAITIVGCVLSFGGGFAAAGAQAAGTAAKAGETTMQAAKIADTVGKIVDRTRLVASFASGVNSVGMGVTSGVKAASDYRITKSQAEQKELEAILERIQQAITNEQDFMEAIMKRSQELLGDVGEIVQNNSETQTKLLTNASPSMA